MDLIPERPRLPSTISSAASSSASSYTTPTYVLSLGGSKATVPGFQPLEAYEVALQNLAPHLERHSVPDPLGLLEGRPGEPCAAVEVATATGHTPEEAIAVLDDLVRRGRVRRLDMGDGRALWCAGSSTIQLRCPCASAPAKWVARELAA